MSMEKNNKTDDFIWNTEGEQKISNTMLARGEIRRLVASPSDEMFLSAEENIEQPSFDDIEDTEELMLHDIQYMAGFQQHMFEMDKVTVSDTFCYHAIRWDPVKKTHSL